MGVALTVVVAASLVIPSSGRAAAQAPTDSVPIPVGGQTDWDGIAGAGPASETPTVGSNSMSVAVAGDVTRLHVKFHEDTGVDLTETGLVPGDPDGGLAQALLGIDGLGARRLFTTDPTEIRAARAEAELRTGRAIPDLSTWWLIETPTIAEGHRLARELRALSVVEMVQPEPFLATTQAAEEAQQGYLDPAPTGVGAELAWGRSGGAGANVTIAVIDSGFDTDHPDLDRVSGPGVAIPHEAPWESHHGLQVLGILAADDDLQGIRGLAHGAGIRTVNSGRSSGHVANAISLAAGALGPGDVITISQGICAASGCADGIVLPLVYSASARDALRSAAGAGVITVVSGGNGGANLDNYRSRLGTDAPDTIVVGAGNPQPVSGCSMEDGPPRSRVGTSNYGPRVDLQGWGACVRTTRQGGDYLWWGFTSAATPVVAGAAALVSSMAEARGVTLTGSQVRSLLEATGSPQVASRGSIGPLPDTTAAVDAVGNLPANDNWAGSRELTAIPSVLNIDMRFAGVQVDEPTVTCGSISHTRWYHFTPASDIELRFDTSGSDFDTMIGLWRRDGDRLVREACADDITVNNGSSRLTHVLSAGETYYIQAGGTDGASGRMRLVIEPSTAAGLGCDVDGDRRGDIVSGSPAEDVGDVIDAGRALVHYGRRGKPRRVVSIDQGWPGLAGGSEKRDRFGQTVVCGDFNGDGTDDVAIGAPWEGLAGAPRAGAVHVLDGSASGLVEGARTLTQKTRGVRGTPERGDRFGSALAVGDFDGDGFADLAVGVKGEDHKGVADAGGVHVFPGSPDGLVARGVRMIHAQTRGVAGRAEPGDGFGTALAAGDLDGDGVSELAIGLPGEDLLGEPDVGAVVVLAGGSAGLELRGGVGLRRDAFGLGDSSRAGARFGATLAFGDLDGDGDDELVIGAPGATVDGFASAGEVYVLAGAADWADGMAVSTMHQAVAGVRGDPGSGDRFGAAVAIGDVNADGWEDLAVGVPGETVSGQQGAGAVHLFDGSAAGVSVAGDQLLHQGRKGVRGRPRAGDAFGSAVTMVDGNGDMRRDLVVAAPGERLGRNANAGVITIFPGQVDGVSSARSKRLTQRSPDSGRNETGDRFGTALAP